MSYGDLNEQKEEEKDKDKGKENIEEYKDETEEKIKRIFKKIKTFEELKSEVLLIKKSYEKTMEDVNDYKEKYNYIMNRYILISKNKGESFEKLEEDKKYKNILDEKLLEIDKKFKIIFGNSNTNESEENNFNINIEKNINIINKDNNNKNDIKNNINNEKNINNKNIKQDLGISNNNNITIKSDKGNKQKILNLTEIYNRLVQLYSSKVNINDFKLKNEIFEKKLIETDKKYNELILKIFGENTDNKNENYGNKKSLGLISKIELEKNKKDNDDEFLKIWEEINNIKKIIDDINNNDLKEKINLTDLENMKNLILQNSEEIFKNINKKYNENSSSLRNLQEFFKKLLELLALKEEHENESWLLAKKTIPGFSCASCENYLGELKNDKNKYIHWNKMPLRERDLNDEKYYRIGNGYSRLLKMVNFDKNGNMSLNYYNNNENNKSKDKITLTKSFSRERNHSARNKKELKEKNKTIDIKPNNLKEKLNKKFPKIKNSMSMSTDNFDKIIDNSNQNFKNLGSNTSLNFMSPIVKKDLKKSHLKYNL